MLRGRVRWLIVAGFAAAGFGVIGSAHATTVLTVDTTADDPAASACLDATPNDCSLRGALVNANADGTAEIEEIDVPAGTYTLSAAGSGDTGGSLNTLYSVSIIGAGSASTVVDADGRSRVLDVTRGAGNVDERVVDISGITFMGGDPCAATSDYGNDAGGNNGGGAIFINGRVSLTDVVVEDNVTCSQGGGIQLQRYGSTLDMDHVVVRNNTARTDGGGIEAEGTLSMIDSTVADNVASAAPGGGLRVVGGSATITRSTISGNTGYGHGGGIASGTDAEGGTITAVNSTISDNVAAHGGYPSAGSGGGIWSQFSKITLRHVTVTANIAQANPESGFGGHAGGVSTGGTDYYGRYPDVDIQNSIIAGNDPSDQCDFAGATFPATSSILGNGCAVTGTGNQDVDPQLGPLGDNGGPTQTRVPQIGSPAIDAADDSLCEATDQRGQDRPIGPHCDVGSVEGLPPVTIDVAENVSASDGNEVVPPVDVDANETVAVSDSVTVEPQETEPPTISIDTPPSDAQYLIGSAVHADYSCDDGAGTGVATCEGPVADGTAIDTSTTGLHEFTVDVADNAGNQASMTVQYRVYDADSGEVRYLYTGRAEDFVVPDGVTRVRVALVGGKGGDPGYAGGGLGAHVEGTLDVTPGETLVVRVGGDGNSRAQPGTPVFGGFNGGGDGEPGSTQGAGGGGASDISRGSTRLMVAGGGGGAGGAVPSETSGSLLIGTGGDAGRPGSAANGGGAGTSTSGGLGGVDALGGGSGVNGIFGRGGSGGFGHFGGGGGGGGGGGYYGGGGGAGGGGSSDLGVLAGGGGGGGSSYTGDAVDPSVTRSEAGVAAAVRAVEASTLAAVDPPSITITFQPQATTTLSSTPTPSSETAPVTLNDSATLSDGDAPTGTITFALYPPVDAACTGTPVYTKTVTVSGNGTYSTAGSGSSTGTNAASKAGTWHWTAIYSGDTNNTDSSSACADETAGVFVDTTTTYAGQTYDADGGTTSSLSATLSSLDPACLTGDVAFTPTPVGGSALPAQHVHNSSPSTSVATAYALAQGIYEIDVAFTPDNPFCNPSSDFAVLTVVGPGQTANGGGWYRVDGFSPPRVSFGFAITKKVDRRTNVSTYSGQLLWIDSGHWRLKGTISGTTAYGTFPCPAGVGTTGSNPKCGSFSGTGVLQTWDGSAGAWVASTYGTVTFTATAYDGGSITVCKKKVCTKSDLTDSFGIQIDPVPSSVVPESAPLPLKGGSVKLS